jgi:CxxC-x17-CxxC domain-containing protein
MHDAVCARCGQACQVPFEPTNGRPVYCSDCFTSIRR